MGRTCLALIRESTESTNKSRITKQKYWEGRFTPYLTSTLISSPSSFSSSSSPLCRYLVDLGLFGFWFICRHSKGEARSVRFWKRNTNLSVCLCEWGRTQSAHSAHFPLKFFSCSPNFNDIQIFYYFQLTSITGDQIFLLSPKYFVSSCQCCWADICRNVSD